MGKREGQQNLANLKGGANCLSMVGDRNVSENRTFIGLIPKHSLKDYAFSVTCLEVCQWIKHRIYQKGTLLGLCQEFYVSS